MRLRFGTSLLIGLVLPLVLISGCKTTHQSTNREQPRAETVSTQQEINIGRNMMAGIVGTAPLVQNDPLQHYVNRVGRWVALQSSRPNLPWTFGVIDTPHINALGAPGGYVVITLGLYQLLQTEDQLASVLAREISHINRKHQLSALDQHIQTRDWRHLMKTADNDKTRNLLVSPIVRAIHLYAGGLAPQQEFTADREALELAARSGYDPFALLDVLATLSSIDPANDSVQLFSATRPALSQRIQNLNQLTDRNLSEFKVPAPNNRLHQTNQQIVDL